MGSIGDCYDNAMIESFWGRVQTELLDRRRWRTRLELANALFEYLEMFHNRRRRHTALGMLTPIEYELHHARIAPVARTPATRLRETRAGSEVVVNPVTVRLYPLTAEHVAAMLADAVALVVAIAVWGGVRWTDRAIAVVPLCAFVALVHAVQLYRVAVRFDDTAITITRPWRRRRRPTGFTWC
jgi:Integrase core domain